MITTMLAPNPGPMTLDGTNTHLLDDLVVDPGPADHDHLSRIAAARPTVILLTHRHLDHSAGAGPLAERTGAVVRAVDHGLCRGAGPLVDGEVILTATARVAVVATPGHTDDSVCLWVQTQDGGSVLLSGDTILGRGTTVITHPEGNLGDYLASLDRLAAVIDQGRITEILPGHGPTITDPAEVIIRYRRHRLERLDQVRAALASGAHDADAVVDVVYRDVDPAVRPAALQSVRAQLAYLDRNVH